MIGERFERKHLDAAIALFDKKCRIQRDETPSLDACHVGSSELKIMLINRMDECDGVALMEGDTLLGYMTGFYVDELLSPNKGIYIPEWCHAAVDQNTFDLYRELYLYGSKEWTKQGCLSHAISFLNCDKQPQQAFLWNGFGYQCIDAVTTVDTITLKNNTDIEVKPIHEDAISIWEPMVREHYRHLLSAPILKPDFEIPDAGALLRMLNEEGGHAWMAYIKGCPAGYMKIASVEDGAAWIVNGKNKFAVNGAYIHPHYRRMGIAARLLGEIMEWGKSNGFKRCSVDFESSNLEACRFWLQYFKPVCVSMLRRIDPRVLTPVL